MQPAWHAVHRIERGQKLGVGSSGRVDLILRNDLGAQERSRTMVIIGCDFHARYQQIAMLDREMGARRPRNPEVSVVDAARPVTN